MKNSILKMSACAIIASAIVMGCNTSAQNLENAQENVSEANKELDKAHQEYLDDVEKYRQEIVLKIAANNQSIADFNARITNEKAEAKAEYLRKIAVIEQKNSDMKKKMDDYKADGKEQWKKFKSEFSHDMEELGKAFKDLTVTNTK